MNKLAKTILTSLKFKFNANILSLLHNNVYTMARYNKKVQQNNQLQHSNYDGGISKRNKLAIIRKLINYCKDDNKQEVDLILDKQFYDNLQNSKRMTQILPWKTSVDFYFRDYPAVLMNLKNQQIFQQKNMNQDINFIKKALIYILMNHKDLSALISKQQKHPITNKSFFSLYIKAICRLILGQQQKGQKIMITIINTPFKELTRNENAQQYEMMDKQNPNILNFRQQILFNLLQCQMFKDVQEGQSNKNKLTPMQLYTKLKNKQKIELTDLKLTNYQQFLNIWVSAKFDAPMQWSDLQQQQKQQYLKYIYLLAQNCYIRKQSNKSKQILYYLPLDYPLRIFLQLSQLYDNHKYQQMRIKLLKLQQKIENNKISYFKFPQFDIVMNNILQVMRKMQEKTKNQQSDIEQTIQYFKYNNSIIDTNSKGIPFYYLNIPFTDFLTSPQLIKIYD